MEEHLNISMVLPRIQSLGYIEGTERRTMLDHARLGTCNSTKEPTDTKGGTVCTLNGCMDRE
jgi:hypothetical protein